LTLLICIFIVKADEDSNKCSDISLEVSGGGVVKLGDRVNVTMPIPVDEDDRNTCVLDVNDKKYCTLKKTGDGSKMRCHDSSKESLLTGDITEDKCTFSILNMTDEFIGNIELEVDFCEKSSELSLFKETNITEVIIPSENGVIANEPVEVECHVVKGSYITEVSFMLMEGEEIVKNFTEEVKARNEDDHDIYTASVTLQKDDQGKMLCCQALQKNGDSVIGKTTKMSEALNIWFLDDLTISNDAGNFTVIVYSNPEPKLTVNCENEVETCKNLTLSDFTFEKVPDNDFKYESHHQIFETEQEWMKTVSLQFEVTNDKNQTKSDVKPLIEIKDEEATGDDLDNPEENNKTDEEQVEGEGEDEGGNAGLTAVIVILVILGVLGGVWYYRKRKSSQVERLPLSGQSMSSLN